ncbi:hypothetical protein JCM10449v2_004529 [Rhodotorula kratochvilovae]
MSTASGSASPPASSSSASAPTKRRIAKACEPCRIRRTRCDGEQPCKKCTQAGGLVCTYRLKARPSRRPRLIRPFSLAQSGPAADGDGVPLHGLRAIEAELERQYEERTGTPISLALPDVDTQPALALDTPLPTLPTFPDADLDALCDTFVREVLVFFTFLSPARLHQLVQRQRDLPETLTADQLALLYAVYAMGYLRRITAAQATVTNTSDAGVARADVAWFRHAFQLVGDVASVTALQTLHILQLYTLAAASVHTSRQVLSKICWGVQELGLHKQATANAYPPEFGTASTFFMCVWNDTYIAGLTGHAPFLHDVDMDLLTETAENSGIVAPAMAQLVLLEADLLREAHSNPARLRDPSFVLAHDARLFAFLKEFGSQTDDYTNMASSFGTTHYHFQRMLLRAPSSTDPILGPSSLAILSRSATHLVQHYERIFLTTRHNNCVWSVLLRVVGAGHAILQALWHGDIVRLEADAAMAKVMWLLEKLGERWTAAAGAAYANFIKLMTVLELDLPSPPTPTASTSGALASSSSPFDPTGGVSLPALPMLPALPALPAAPPPPPPATAADLPPPSAAAYGTFFDLAPPAPLLPAGMGMGLGAGGPADGVLGEMFDFWGGETGFAGLGQAHAGGGEGAFEEAARGEWWKM